MAIDLFCGAGGLSLGLRQAGFHVAAAVDCDPLACNAYRLNHPLATVIQADIARLGGRYLLRRAGAARADLLAACPPCQGFSTVRTRNGRRQCDEPQNDLVLEVLRMAAELRPAAVLLENVPGLARDPRYRAVERGLSAMGYRFRSHVLDAADYGVPQRRRRLLLLASRFAMPRLAAPARQRRTVRQAIGRARSLRAGHDALHNYTTNHSPRVMDMIRLIPRDGGSRAALGTAEQLACHLRCDGFRDVYGRMAWDEPAPTITGGCINPSKGRFLHPEVDRAITLREAALLQTFPRSYRFPLTQGRYAVAKLIGNALPPEFARRHALALLATIGRRRRTGRGGGRRLWTT
ncbi:MAG: DNA cytosine methyltransferase [Terriglobales bacterium]